MKYSSSQSFFLNYLNLVAIDEGQRYVYNKAKFVKIKFVCRARPFKVDFYRKMLGILVLSKN